MYHLTMLWICIALIAYIVGWFAGNASAKRRWFGGVKEIRRRSQRFDAGIRQAILTDQYRQSKCESDPIDWSSN